MLKLILDFLISLEDLTYVEETINYLALCSIMPDIACRLRRSIQAKKNKILGINPEILQQRPKEAKLMSTIELIHTNFRTFHEILPGVEAQNIGRTQNNNINRY